MHYERLRERVLGGDGRHSVGEAIVRGQGLWAFVALVAAEAPSGTRVVRRSSVALPTAPVAVRGALLAAWTDLVVAAVRRPEVS